MFIVPAIVAFLIGLIGLIGLFYGKDDPSELGWDEPELIFGEEEPPEDLLINDMSKLEVFKQFVITNPMVWVLATANVFVYNVFVYVFVYIVRIGIDNWGICYWVCS